MADSTSKNIENVKVGDFVMGLFGEANCVMALDQPPIGDRPCITINGEHKTTPEHPHVGANKTVFSLKPEGEYEEQDKYYPVIVDNEGTVENWLFEGLKSVPIQQMHVGETYLQKSFGVVALVTSVVSESLPSETRTYHLVLDGSYTYFVNGYCTLGWYCESGWDWETWRAIPTK